MEKDEYLNEEDYLKTKDKLQKAVLIILIISLISGIICISGGFISKFQTKKINRERYVNAYRQSEAKVAEAKDRLNKLKKDLDSAEKELSSKEAYCKTIPMSDNDWFNKVSNCNKETQEISKEINSYKMEIFKIENTDYTVLYEEKKDKQALLTIVGLIIIAIGGLISGLIHIFANKREISAFTTQQSLPIEQERIEKMAPSFSKAAEEVTKGISSRIKDGLNDEIKEEKHEQIIDDFKNEHQEENINSHENEYYEENANDHKNENNQEVTNADNNKYNEESNDYHNGENNQELASADNNEDKEESNYDYKKEQHEENTSDNNNEYHKENINDNKEEQTSTNNDTKDNDFIFEQVNDDTPPIAKDEEEEEIETI